MNVTTTTLLISATIIKRHILTNALDKAVEVTIREQRLL